VQEGLLPYITWGGRRISRPSDLDKKTTEKGCRFNENVAPRFRRLVAERKSGRGEKERITHHLSPRPEKIRSTHPLVPMSKKNPIKKRNGGSEACTCRSKRKKVRSSSGPFPVYGRGLSQRGKDRRYTIFLFAGPARREEMCHHRKTGGGRPARDGPEEAPRKKAVMGDFLESPEKEKREFQAISSTSPARQENRLPFPPAAGC